MFEIITVAIVLGIITLFGIGAYKAEKIINAKAKAAREAQAKLSAKTSKTPKTQKTPKASKKN